MTPHAELKAAGIGLPLRTRLVLTFAFVAVIPLGVTLLITSSITRSQFRRNSISEIESVKGIVRSALERAGQELENKANGAMQRHDLRELLFQFDDERSERARVLSEMIKLATRVREEVGLTLFEIVDGKGMILASAQEPGVFQVEDASLLGLIDTGRKEGRPFIAVRRGLTVKGLAFLVVKTMEDLGQEIVLVAGIPIDEGFLASLPHTATTAIVITSAAEQRVIVQDTPVGNIVKSLLAPAVAAKVLPSSAAVQELQLGGKMYFAGAVPLPGVSIVEPAFFHVLSSQENLASVLSRFALLFVLLALTGCALAWGLGYWFAFRITSPVQALVQGLERVARGDLDTEIPTKRHDEIGVVISSFNRMTQDLKSLRENLLRAERLAAWQEIARRIAHEIKNPLSPIQLCIETLRKSYAKGLPDFEAILDESTRTIQEEVEKLKTIVKEFSDFARLPKPILDRENIHNILKQVIALYSGARDTYTFRLNLTKQDALAMVDSGQINQVFINIIKNAMEAMPEGGEITVRTRVDERTSLIIVEIEDTGTGIHPDRIGDLFKPYFTDKPGGSGLGLAIAHRIVDEHGGQIKAVNNPEGGAAFIIELPLSL